MSTNITLKILSTSYLFFFFACVSVVFSEEPLDCETSVPDPVTETLEQVHEEEQETDDRPELWFPVGEELVYRIFWGRIPVGRTQVITEWMEHEDRTLLLIRIRTRTNRVLNRIYPVDDVIESWIDPHTFLPVRFELNMSQGRHRKHEITEFDYDNLVAHWRSITRERENTFELEPETRDLVSFSYYLRRHPFAPGEEREYRVMADEKIYDLRLEARKKENVRLQHYGRMRSVEVEPEAAFEGMLVRRGRMFLWISDDDRRLLTQMEATIPVANVRLVLHRVRGPGNDAWIKDWDEEDEEDDF